MPTLMGIEGEARVAVGAEASLNGGKCGTLSLAWGLVDGNILDIPHRRSVLAGIGPTSLRHRALFLLSHRSLKERPQLVVRVTRPGRRRFWESFE
jgi:hypothetical protein